MAITFDSSKIAMFRDAQFASGNTIANLGDDGLTAGGTYHGALGAITRTKAEKAENNKVRTELLRSLGQAFGLSGMSEADGKVSFSKDFMDQLESILGKDVFKRDDFKIGADGTVTSGRPLTSRRISAIIAKATTAAQGVSGEPEMETLGPILEPDVPEVETVKTVTTTKAGPAGAKAATDGQEVETVRTVTTTVAGTDEGEADTESCLPRFRALWAEIEPMEDDPPPEPVLRLGLSSEEPPPAPKGPKARFKEYFESVGRCLEFFEKHFEGMISENEKWVSNERNGISNEGVARYVITHPKTQERIPMHTATDLTNFLNRNKTSEDLNIGLFEPSFYTDIIPKGGIKTPEALEALKGYIRSTAAQYAQGSINLYFDAKAAGKLDEFIALSPNTGGCMDGRANRVADMRQKLRLEDEGMNAANHTSDTDLYECITAEMTAASNRIEGGAKNWGQVKNMVKSALVGQIRPIMTVDSQNKVVPLMENGKQVVRAITAEDVEKVGRICAFDIFFE